MTHLIIWLATGLVVGWLARIVMQSHRDYGAFGDLLTGCLGAVLGGWMTRRFGVLAPDNLLGHIFIATTGAVALLAAIRALRRLLPVITSMPENNIATHSVVLEAERRHSADFVRSLVARFSQRGMTIADPHQAFDTQLTFGERVADKVASFGGSWTFIGLFFIAMIVWMAVNEELPTPLDPFPFILLNLILSCLAAIQAPVIMMSQNRQSVRDRLDARNDYEVNLRAEIEIMALHAKLDAARNEELAQLAKRMEALAAHLVRIEAQLPDAHQAQAGSL